MESRSFPFRNRCPEFLMELFENLSHQPMFLVQEYGPTSFLIKEGESGKKFKVLIGNPHTCNCKNQDLCFHIMFVVLKILRVPQENPLAWQRALIDSEVTQILRGRFVTKAKPRQIEKQIEDVERRAIEEDEVCPICQEELNAAQEITYCKKGCGNNIHLKCMRVWAEHRYSLREPVTCPLCRSEWGSLAIESLKKEEKSYRRPSNVHYGVSCDGCHTCPIYNMNYRCVFCQNYDLCSRCFHRGVHSQHPFICRQRTDEIWMAAHRVEHKPELTQQILDLQSREISTSDYNLLLSLDNSSRLSLHEHLLNALPNALHFQCSNVTCSICQLALQPPVKILPCSHLVHHSCVVELILNHKNTCPTDNAPIFAGLSRNSVQSREQKRSRKRESSKSMSKPSQSKQDRNEQIQLGVMGLSIQSAQVSMPSINAGNRMASSGSLSSIHSEKSEKSTNVSSRSLINVQTKSFPSPKPHSNSDHNPSENKLLDTLRVGTSAPLETNAQAKRSRPQPHPRSRRASLVLEPKISNPRNHSPNLNDNNLELRPVNRQLNPHPRAPHKTHDSSQFNENTNQVQQVQVNNCDHVSFNMGWELNEFGQSVLHAPKEVQSHPQARPESARHLIAQNSQNPQRAATAPDDKNGSPNLFGVNEDNKFSDKPSVVGNGQLGPADFTKDCDFAVRHTQSSAISAIQQDSLFVESHKSRPVNEMKARYSIGGTKKLAPSRITKKRATSVQPSHYTPSQDDLMNLVVGSRTTIETVAPSK